MGGKALTGAEVAKHNSRDSCWIIVHGKAYDVTEFLDEHPGGSKIILKYAGKDATQEYEPIHPPDAITANLHPSKHLGPVDLDTVEKVHVEITPAEKARQERTSRIPPLSTILNLHDFEAIARNTLTDNAWAYYSSAAEDEIAHRENHYAWHRIWFRPRVMRDVTHVDTSSSLLGFKSSMPIYISATALGRLGHPDGEMNLTRAAAKYGVIQMVPTLASCSLDEIFNAAEKPKEQGGQTMFFQLYVNRDKSVTERVVRDAEAKGAKALFVTVDAPQLGRREKDMRMKFEIDDPAAQAGAGGAKDRSQGAARAISVGALPDLLTKTKLPPQSFIDPGLSWADLKWMMSITKMPIILKGVQAWEDALLAYDAGCAGVVLSNHGGRQLEFARSGVEVLAEVVTELKARRGLKFPGGTGGTTKGGWNGRFEVYVDGGVRRASDALKAVAMGATAVGLGRPFIYAFSSYGQAGVEQALQILKDEFEMNMRLLGARSLEEVVPEMVDARSVGTHVVAGPTDRLYDSNYDGLAVASLRDVKAKL